MSRSTIISSYPPTSSNVRRRYSDGSSSYPENQSRYAFTTRLGVSSNPSRSGSSPAHRNSVRTASSAAFRETFRRLFPAMLPLGVLIRGAARRLQGDSRTPSGGTALLSRWRQQPQLGRFSGHP